MHLPGELEDAQLAIPLPALPETEASPLIDLAPAPPDGRWRSFDHELALENVGGEEQLLAQIARAFCISCHGLRYRLRDGIDRRDPQTVQIIAHTLKGGARQFASIRASSAARELEEAAMNRDWPGVHLAFEALEMELNRLLPELATLAAVACADSESTG